MWLVIIYHMLTFKEKTRENMETYQLLGTLAAWLQWQSISHWVTVRAEPRTSGSPHFTVSGRVAQSQSHLCAPIRLHQYIRCPQNRDYELGSAVNLLNSYLKLYFHIYQSYTYKQAQVQSLYNTIKAKKPALNYIRNRPGE